MNCFKGIWSFCSCLKLIRLGNELKEFIPNMIVVGELATVGIDEVFVNQLLLLLTN